MEGDFIDQIENSRRFGKDPGVVVAARLLENRKPLGIPYIHIAGTNGKGSTAAFLASVLQSAGYRTGLFTSPHLIDFTERIRVNGKRIRREEASRLAGRLISEAAERKIEPGMFDYCTVMAVDYFQETGCEIAVIETGLGGRLDATNALGIPALTVITPIGLDHVQILGNSLVQIAKEKAGILKSGSCAVFAPQGPEAERVLAQACLERGIPYRTVERKPESGVSYQERAAGYELGLPGHYQVENAATALLAVEELRKRGICIPEEAVRIGLAQARWPGRLEQVHVQPDIFLDGAHNLHGVRALRESLEIWYPARKFHFLMGVLADKDYMEMISDLLPIAARIDTVTPESSRALQGGELSRIIGRKGVPSDFHPDPVQALLTLKEQPAQQPICVFGSLYFIGEAEKILHGAAERISMEDGEGEDREG